MRKKTGKIVNCKICNKEFYRPLNKLKNNKNHYCSRNCYKKARSTYYAKENAGNWQGGLLERECCYCNKKIKVKRHKEKFKNVFCSKDCQLNGTIRFSKGSNASNWRGGLSKEGYPYYFNQELKDQIRLRDNYTCQNCEMTEEEHLIVIGSVLDTHHIDYNKQNCIHNNLITLCRSCNIRANYNRDYWKAIYKRKIKRFKNETA